MIRERRGKSKKGESITGCPSLALAIMRSCGTGRLSPALNETHQPAQLRFREGRLKCETTAGAAHADRLRYATHPIPPSNAQAVPMVCFVVQNVQL